MSILNRVRYDPPLPLRVLILEDHPADAEMMLDELRGAGYEPDYQLVASAADYAARLNPHLDLILADYSLPQFDAPSALRLLQQRQLDIPFIIVSGTVGEEETVALMKLGASDYLLKDRLARLGSAVAKALEDKRQREAQRKAVEEIRRLKVFNEDIVQTLTEGIVVQNADGIITFVNPAAAAMVGYTPEEAIGLDFLAIKPFIPEAQHAALEAALQVSQRDDVSHYELDIQSKDGTRRTLFISSRSRFEGGRFDGTLTTLIDITARKREEAELERYREHLEELVDQRTAELIHAKQRLEGILDNATEGIVLAYLERGIEQTNTMFNTLFHCAPDSYFGQPLRMLVLPE
ncbi:MAG: PAS domain S-box protein, partial [Chloroflexota bacterium]